MKTLNSLIEKYAHIQAPDKTLKKAFIKSVEQVTGIEIDIKSIEIFKKTVKVSAPSVIKTEIRLNQRDILTNVAEEVGDKNALTAIL